jgi:hypothetical protein
MASTLRHAALLLNKQGPLMLGHPVHGMDGGLADASWFTLSAWAFAVGLKPPIS